MEGENALKKIFYSVITAFLIVVCVYSFGLYKDKQLPRDMKNEINPNESIAEKNPLKEGENEDFAENADTAANSTNVTKYILKYYNGKSVLICRDSGGVRTETEIADINFDYLTETDKKLLNEGIMLDSLEDVYKLIEDYSS